MATDAPPDIGETKPDLAKECVLEDSGVETLDPAAEKKLVRKIDWLSVSTFLTICNSILTRSLV